MRNHINNQENSAWESSWSEQKIYYNVIFVLLWLFVHISFQLISDSFEFWWFAWSTYALIAFIIYKENI